MRKPHSSGLIPVHFRYKDLSGVSRPKVVYGHTEKEALKKKQDFLKNVSLCLRMDEQGKTVSSWVDDWLSTYKKPLVSERTYQTYEHDAELIKTAIGHKLLKAVTPSELQAIVNTRKGLSASAIKKTTMTIKAVFQSAVENRIIQASPAVGLRAVKGPAGTHRALNDAEVKAIVLTCQAGHRFAPAAMLMLFAGLRRGEAAALTYEDIKGGYIHVKRAVSWPVNQGVVKSPKSRAGTRSIPVMPPLEPFVTGKGLVLPSADGKLISETGLNWVHESFVKACGVSFKCHDLRHSYATMIFDAGVDVKTAQSWLGHDDPTVTMRIYTHLSLTRKTASTNSAQRFFKKLSGNINGNSSKAKKPKTVDIAEKT